MLNKECMLKVQERFDNLIKPVGSLAKLEKLVGQFAGAHAKTTLDYPQKALLVLNYSACNLKEQINLLEAAKLDELVTIQVLNATTVDMNAAVEALVAQGVEVLAFGYSGKESDSFESEQAVQLIRQGVLKAVELGIPVVLDGYISVYGAYLAYEHNPLVKDYLIASYKNELSEQAELLKNLGLSELLSLHLGSENGLGSLLTFSLLNAGIRAYKDMRTFEEARVEYALADLK